MNKEKAIYVLEMNNPFMGGEKQHDLSEAIDMAIKALEGKHYERAILIPDSATNGEMIEAIFPSEVWLQMKAREFNKTWWNAPYEGGKEE